MHNPSISIRGPGPDVMPIEGFDCSMLEGSVTLHCFELLKVAWVQACSLQSATCYHVFPAQLSYTIIYSVNTIYDLWYDCKNRFRCI